jgi:hypothetical protein
MAISSLFPAYQDKDPQLSSWPMAFYAKKTRLDLTDGSMAKQFILTKYASCGQP